MYMKIIHAMDGNKITFQHSVRYKNIDDEMIHRNVWKRTKKPTLEKLNYPKLSNPMRQTLADKRKESIELYRKVNEAIEKGENTSVIITKNKKGERVSPRARDRVMNTVKDFKMAHEALCHIAF